MTEDIGADRSPARAGRLGALVPAVLSAESYRKLWYTGALYYQSHWMEITVTGWVVLEVTNSAAAVGVVAFFRSIPMLILGLIFGTLSDRFPRLNVLFTIQSTGMLAAAGFSMLFLLGMERLWIICVLSCLAGCAWAADFATRRALITELNTRENTASAMSLEALSQQAGRVLAPVVGGVLLGVGGAPAAYLFLTGMFAVNIVSMMRLRSVSATRRRPEKSSSPMLHLIRSGWSTVIQIPIVRVALIITVIMNLMVFPYQHLIALVAGEILDVGPGRMGVLSGAAGVGSALVAGFLTFRSRPATARRFFAGGATFAAIALIALAVSTSFQLSVGIQLLIGAGFGAFGAMQSVLVANAVEPEMRARALGVLAMAIGTGPIGMLMTGGLSSVIGASWTIGGLATIASVLLITTLIRNWQILWHGSPEPARQRTS